MFAVYERDGWAQTDAFAAYGVCNLPLTPGLHDVEAHCWRANNRNARMREEIAARRSEPAPASHPPREREAGTMRTHRCSRRGTGRDRRGINRASNQSGAGEASAAVTARWTTHRRRGTGSLHPARVPGDPSGAAWAPRRMPLAAEGAGARGVPPARLNPPWEAR